jgi:hypothetical protein
MCVIKDQPEKEESEALASQRLEMILLDWIEAGSIFQ